MFARTVFAAALAAGLCVPSWAQVFPGQSRNQGRAQQPRFERFEATGTVAAVARGRIKLLTNTQQSWVVVLSPRATIHVTGTADVDYLRVGHFVRFDAALDKKGKVQGKVAELTIFTPSAEFGVGLWPEGMAVGDVGAEEAKPQPPNPFANPGFGVGNPGMAQPGMAQPGMAQPGMAQPGSNRFLVAGRITGNRKGKMILNYGRGMSEIELAEKPTINVDFADYSVAQQGDMITVTQGKTYPNQFQMLGANPNAVGQALAEGIEIQLSQPLAAPGKKTPRSAPGKPKEPAAVQPNPAGPPNQAVPPKQPPAVAPGVAPGGANPFGNPPPQGQE